MSRITPGTYTAIARSWELGLSSKNKTEQIAVQFELLDGSHAGHFITWFGYFTEAARDRTFENLRICGWVGDDILTLTGMGSCKVSLVIEDEHYNGKTNSRVRWVNRLGGSVRMGATMDEAHRRQFAARMRMHAGPSSTSTDRSSTLDGTSSRGVTDDEIPF
jgi:hypothetical protein